MVKGESLRRSISSSGKTDSKSNYDYLKEIIKIARKNGWDLERLGLVRKDLPANPTDLLSKKEFQQRNRFVRNVLKQFSRRRPPRQKADVGGVLEYLKHWMSLPVPAPAPTAWLDLSSATAAR